MHSYNFTFVNRKLLPFIQSHPSRPILARNAVAITSWAVATNTFQHWRPSFATSLLPLYKYKCKCTRNILHCAKNNTYIVFLQMATKLTNLCVVITINQHNITFLVTTTRETPQLLFISLLIPLHSFELPGWKYQGHQIHKMSIDHAMQ